MTKKELALKVAEGTGISQAKANDALDSVMNAIIDAVAAGDKVHLAGFGTFERKHRATRVGRNPQTKEAVEIPAYDSPSFKAALAFKNKVNG